MRDSTDGPAEVAMLEDCAVADSVEGLDVVVLKVGTVVVIGSTDGIDAGTFPPHAASKNAKTIKKVNKLVLIG